MSEPQETWVVNKDTTSWGMPDCLDAPIAFEMAAPGLHEFFNAMMPVYQASITPTKPAKKPEPIAAYRTQNIWCLCSDRETILAADPADLIWVTDVGSLLSELRARFPGRGPGWHRAWQHGNQAVQILEIELADLQTVSVTEIAAVAKAEGYAYFHGDPSGIWTDFAALGMKPEEYGDYYTDYRNGRLALYFQAGRAARFAREEKAAQRQRDKKSKEACLTVREVLSVAKATAKALGRRKAGKRLTVLFQAYNDHTPIANILLALTVMGETADELGLPWRNSRALQAAQERWSRNVAGNSKRFKKMADKRPDLAAVIDKVITLFSGK